MTAVPAGEHYYYNHYSPPVSPKSIPHGYKRKASTQEDDEIETNNVISHHLKKLRLSKSLPSRINRFLRPADSKRPSAAPPRDFRDVTPSEASLSRYSAQASRHNSQAWIPHGSEDDMMPVDDTDDRVWVHDLDAEIAAIEAEEAALREADNLFSNDVKEHTKIPDHLLRPNGTVHNPASDMQIVLYCEPVSISVDEDHDAVRKTVIEARRRVREKQAQEKLIADDVVSQLARRFDPPSSVSNVTENFEAVSSDDEANDDMDLD